MLKRLTLAEPDAILSLMSRFREDPRPKKMDLGVGVYRDASGATPILRAVREAERRHAAAETTKVYVGIAGDADFNRRVAKIALGPAHDPDRTRAIQTPGGSGALRVLMDLAHLANPNCAIWLSNPTWPNHAQIAGAAGLRVAQYPFVDGTGALRFEDALAALRTASAGDLALIHGSCHNPTGVDLTLGQWRTLADTLAERGVLPLVDLAYQGFGDGLDEDAAGLRLLVSKVPETLIAVSCSKNFAVYRDRVGAAIVVGRGAAQAAAAASRMEIIARTLYSMPPHHGAAVVSTVLGDEALRADWMVELGAMPSRMQSLRAGLAEALRRAANSARFDRLAEGKGMFARLGLSPAQVGRLRREHGVYMVQDSRINVAGLDERRLDELGSYIAGVL